MSSFVSVLSFHGIAVTKLGLLIYDASANSLELRFRRGLNRLPELDEDDLEVIELLPEVLQVKNNEFGPLGLVEWLEEHCSNAIQISERIPLEFSPSTMMVNSLFDLLVMGQSTSPLN